MPGEGCHAESRRRGERDPAFPASPSPLRDTLPTGRGNPPAGHADALRCPDPPDTLGECEAETASRRIEDRRPPGRCRRGGLWGPPMTDPSANASGPIHPGAGRRRAVLAPQGEAGRSRGPRRGPHLLGDRPRRRDLLIEHLHLIQDHYHAPRRRAPRGPRRGDAAGAGRGLRGRHLLRPLRHRRRRRGRPPAADRPRLRQHRLLPGGGERLCERSGRAARARTSGWSAPRAWADATRRRRSSVGRQPRRPRDGRVGRRRASSRADSSPVLPELDARFDGYVARGGYRLLRDCLDGPARRATR